MDGRYELDLTRVVVLHCTLKLSKEWRSLLIVGVHEKQASHLKPIVVFMRLK